MAVLENLPGANCGGCGYAGCAAFASALCNDEEMEFCCPVASAEEVAAISEVLGRDLGGTAPVVAFVRCQGSNEKAETRYQYLGVQDCRAAQLIAGGPKDCPFGCLGLGSCVEACKFNALVMGPDGLPKVNEENCVGCGKCVDACPRNIIELVPQGAEVVVGCISKDPGKFVRKYCTVGCISCKKCVKVCPEEAITVEGNEAAVIDQTKCTGCGQCVEACPTHAIVNKLMKV